MWLQMLTALWDYRYEILATCFIFYYRKVIYKDYVFTPLAGGNGKIQMDELVKAVIVIMIVRASVKEGNSTEQVYPDIYWIMIFSAVFAIAALKVNVSKLLPGSKATPAEPTSSPIENL